MQATATTETRQSPQYHSSFELLIFNDFMRTIQQLPLRDEKNVVGKKRQSAVAMIFRLNPKLFKGTGLQTLPPIDRPIGERVTPYTNVSGIFKKYCETSKFSADDHLFELLYMRRAVNERDRHSGQIAFPGGKVDNDETDFEAVLREVDEEIGLNLRDSKKFACIGKLPRNFYCYPTSGGSLYLSSFVFLSLSLEDNIEFKLSKSEVDSVFWVPLKEFLSPDLVSRLIMVQDTTPSIGALGNTKGLKGMLIRWGTNGMKHSEYYKFRLPNELPLYGLTFNMTLYMVQLMIDNTDLLKKLKPEFQYESSNALKLIERGLSFDTVYHRIWHLPKRFLLSSVYYHLRQKQFQLKREKSGLYYLMKLVFLFFILISAKYLFQRWTSL